jgi:hypothetical protein
MDPLSALSVAGTIVQFVDFSAKLIFKSHKLYESSNGALVENLELQAIAESMAGMQRKIKAAREEIGPVYSPVFLDGRQRSRKPTKEEQLMVQIRRENDKELRSVCQQCAIVAEELIYALDSLKVRGTNRKWGSFRVALQSIWDEGKIKKLGERLNALRAQLDTSILFALRYWPCLCDNPVLAC